MLPTTCPLHSPGERDCNLKISHQRARSTGPEFPLFVLVCKEHRIGFTLYPPGYYPYSRHTLAPVSHDGCKLINKTAANKFSGTIFDAALDAAKKNFWSKESKKGSLTPRLWTQGQHVKRIAKLLSIETEKNERQREEVSQILQVPGQLLHDSTIAFRDAAGIEGRGAIISAILKQITCCTTLFERLAEVGAGAGLWPTPLFCEPVHRILVTSPFHAMRTRGSPNKNGAVCCHNFIQ